MFLSPNTLQLAKWACGGITTPVLGGGDFSTHWHLTVPGPRLIGEQELQKMVPQKSSPLRCWRIESERSLMMTLSTELLPTDASVVLPL